MSVETSPYSESEEHESRPVTPKTPLAEDSRLRGRLLEELRAKQQENEATSSRLRGKLLEQISAAPSSERTPLETESEPSRLRGRLLNSPSDSTDAEHVAPEAAEIPKLRGTLLEKRSEAVEPFSKEWLLRQTFIQRDSGQEFIAVGFHQGTSNELVTLMCPKTNARTSHAIDRFVERLQTPGEAWSVKEILG